ncbi:hypothetical protein OIU76_001197 [Salix suchowensis]|nr:hypothetical protein OIU76_001197 [Salix suchowensis]
MLIRSPCHARSSDHLPKSFTITVFLELAMSGEYLFLLAIYLLGFQSPTLISSCLGKEKKIEPGCVQWHYFTRCKGSFHMNLPGFKYS